MSKFIPKLINEDRGTFILIDSPFSAEEGIKYAKEHYHDVKFTCGNYTCAVELLYYLQQEGYVFDIRRRNAGRDVNCDIPVYDTVYCYLPKGDMPI
jgi:hypothetical protein